MDKKLDREYVIREMREQVCMGLEGHSPPDTYTPKFSPSIMGVSIPCRKCKKSIWIDWPERPPADLDKKYPEPRPTPYYPDPNPTPGYP